MNIYTNQLLTAMTNKPPLYGLTKINNDVISGDYDSLVLSCTWHRLRTTTVLNRGCGIGSDELPKYISEMDIELANRIATYYKEKLILLHLKYSNLSNFKKDLSKYLISNRMGFSNNNVGMIYRLPEFYQYDIMIDKMIEEHFPNLHTNKVNINKKDNVTIKPLIKLQKNSSRGDKRVYWFKELTHNLPLFINVERTNQLLTIWDSIFENNSKIELFGQLSTIYHYDNKYLELSHWTTKSDFIFKQKD